VKIENSGVERIAAERKRQISAEGWTSEHDDAHEDGAMAMAAACYAAAACVERLYVRDDGHTSDVIFSEVGIKPLALPAKRLGARGRGELDGTVRSDNAGSRGPHAL
jgi:hypothetical protein